LGGGKEKKKGQEGKRERERLELDRYFVERGSHSLVIIDRYALLLLLFSLQA
jgi:hypothetical protein